MVTAVMMRAIPVAIVSEKDSPNTVMPTITAVTGSIAPKTEVCVAPMCLIASTKVRLDTTVGIMASNSRLTPVDRSGMDWRFPEMPKPKVRLFRQGTHRKSALVPGDFYFSADLRLPGKEHILQPKAIR